jgi:hypothetical protein
MKKIINYQKKVPKTKFKFVLFNDFLGKSYYLMKLVNLKVFYVQTLKSMIKYND